MTTMVFKWLHTVRNPKKVEPYLILIFTNHHIKNIKWSEEFVDQTIDLPIKQWILGCAIFELDLYQKQQTNTQANERSSIFTIYAILVTYPLLFGPEFLLWSYGYWEEIVVAYLRGSWLKGNSWVSQESCWLFQVPENSDRERKEVLVIGMLVATCLQINQGKLWDLSVYSEWWLGYLCHT